MPFGIASGVLGVVGSFMGNNQQQQAQQQAVQAADPYAQYRPQAAQQLNSFMNNPNQISAVVNSPVGQAYQDAAARTMAAQGYTGSGNALVAAANAGGQAYQQQFNNLAMLAGANYSPASAAQLQAQGGQQQNQNTQNSMGALGGLLGSIGSFF
jgi:hypothetical protein